jgi:hypothetical protein
MKRGKDPLLVVPQSFPAVPGTSVIPRSFPKGTGSQGTTTTGPTSEERERLAGTTAGHVERSLTAGAAEVGNVRGGTREKRRGAYCTPKYIGVAIGPFDHDGFSNPHSHIASDTACMLERGDDGFGLGAMTHPGSFFIADPNGPDEHAAPDPILIGELQAPRRGYYRTAHKHTRFWGQPDYSDVLRAYRHYMHTRWAFLLKWDCRPEWWDLIYSAAELVAHLPNSPGKSSFEFEPPPGVKSGAGNSWPHAIYYRYAEDCPEAVIELCSTSLGASMVTRKKSRT